MAFRPEYQAALSLLAQACEIMVERGYGRPILVGGAVVEFYTGSTITSGDFDVITAAGEVLEEILIELGFERPQGVGQLLRGVIHRGMNMGVEVVSGPAFDGKADRERMLLLELGQGKIIIPALEDIIADRLGQFSSTPRGIQSMLDQAVSLYRLASELDEEYLDKRIRYETANTLDLGFLQQAAS